MDKAMLLAMLAQQAPKLLSMIQNSGGLEQVPQLAEALAGGADAGLMEQRAIPLNSRFADHPGLDGIDVLDGLYAPESPDTVFPSDGQGSDISNLFRQLNPSQWKYIGGPQAALSAATFENSPMSDKEFLAGFDEQPVPQEDIPWSDADMDDIHSSEMWESGKKFDPNLKDWYKKNKR